MVPFSPFAPLAVEHLCVVQSHVAGEGAVVPLEGRARVEALLDQGAGRGAVSSRGC